MPHLTWPEGMAAAEDGHKERNILYFAFYFTILWAVSSVGSEHHVDNVEVAGSSPAQPT